MGLSLLLRARHRIKVDLGEMNFISFLLLQKLFCAEIVDFFDRLGPLDSHPGLLIFLPV
jgi:hypothetical protein